MKYMYSWYKIFSKYKLEVPWRWTAPEAIQNQNFTSMSDVWAFGVTLWEIFTYCELPYSSLNNLQVVNQVTNSGLRLPKPDYTSTTEENLQVLLMN